MLLEWRCHYYIWHLVCCILLHETGNDTRYLTVLYVDSQLPRTSPLKEPFNKFSPRKDYCKSTHVDMIQRTDDVPLINESQDLLIDTSALG